LLRSDPNKRSNQSRFGNFNRQGKFAVTEDVFDEQGDQEDGE
jgi:hypothetical protein